MRVVPLNEAPNQTFTMTLGAVRWTLVLKEIRGCMAVSVSRNGEILISNSRALAGEALIPYRYLQSGNFLFLTNGGELPNWRDFNVSQLLVFLTADEIAATPKITVGEIMAAQRRVGYLTTDDGFYITTDSGGLITDD